MFRTRRWTCLVLALSLAGPAWCEYPTEADYWNKTLTDKRQGKSDALHRALGWFTVGAIGYFGHSYYARRANHADQEAQAYRDRAMTHDGVVYSSPSTIKHKPRCEVLPPIAPPEPLPPRVVDLEPARRLERKADRWRDRSFFLAGGALIALTMSALNINRGVQLQFESDRIQVMLAKNFGG